MIKTQVRGKRYLVSILCLACVCFISCGKKDNTQRFSAILEHTDTYIAQNNIQKARKSLKILQKNAISSTQWLSTAKRYRALRDYSGAVQVLKSALVSIPANETITALLVDTLLLQGETVAAASYCNYLLDTRYAALASYVILENNKFEGLSLRLAPVWKIAGEETGLSVFIINAILSYVLDSRYQEALSLFDTDVSSTISIDPYLESLIQYDSGHYSKVKAGTSLESLLLAADAFWLQGERQTATSLWSTVLRDFQNDNPEILYNLAVASEFERDERKFLETCLSAYPAFYPAVVRYVRRAGVPDKETRLDAVEELLHSRGLVSQLMAEKLARVPVSLAQARFVLDAAVAIEPHDPKIDMELVRFEQLQGKDRIRLVSELWNLLERFPKNEDIRSWVAWNFALLNETDQFYSVLSTDSSEWNPFYMGINKALKGDLESAEMYFQECASFEDMNSSALANIAQIYLKQKKYSKAIEYFSLAASMAPNDSIASHLHFRVAKILISQNLYDRAASILGFAIQLDPYNYMAFQLLAEIDSIK